MRLTVIRTASVQSQVLALSRGGATRGTEPATGPSAAQQRPQVVECVYYNLIQTFMSQIVFQVNTLK